MAEGTSVEAVTNMHNEPYMARPAQLQLLVPTVVIR